MTLPAVLLLAGGVLVLVGVAWYAMVIGPDALHLTVLDVPVAGLPPSFDGYRIAVLADLHHGPLQPVARARRAVAFANSQAPHLAVLLGDYGTSEWAIPALSRRWYQRTFRALGPVLGQLRPRDGVVAVIGNHDYYGDDEATARWLRSIGVRVLRGEALELPGPDGVLRLAGIDDLEEGAVDPGHVADLVAGDIPTIVLTHHPDAVRHCGHASVRLVLAGHTHGGQVVLPWVGALVTRSVVCTRRHPSGWIPNPHAPLYVTRGVGSQLPVRLGAPPEVVVVTLRAGQQPT